MTDTRVTPQPWLWQPRTKPILFIEIHATRGNTTPELQMQAALNWVQSARNVGNRKGDGTIDYLNPMWGGSHSYALGTDGSMGTVLDDNQMPTYSAGYGGPGSEWAIDEYGISYEWAQSQALEPFADATYERAATEIAAKCQLYGIPPVMIEVLNQRGPVPTGIVRHDRCENGVKLGKHDPGAQFDEARFIGMVVAKMEDDMGMTPEEKAEFDVLQGQVAGLITQHREIEVAAGKHGPGGMTALEQADYEVTVGQVGNLNTIHQEIETEPGKHGGSGGAHVHRLPPLTGQAE